MGTTASQVTEVNNVAWVKEHATRIDPIVNDPAKVLRYVRDHHPLYGCAMVDFPTLTGQETTQDLAKYADAVAIACRNTAPLPDVDGETKANMKRLNQTSIGNVAYVALHADDELRRNKAFVLIQTWRESGKPIEYHSLVGRVYAPPEIAPGDQRTGSSVALQPGTSGSALQPP